tara:strand:- start:261 stop:515 length:255 start_codon:yes stop_codon:yes gene_type:complete
MAADATEKLRISKHQKRFVSDEVDGEGGGPKGLLPGVPRKKTKVTEDEVADGMELSLIFFSCFLLQIGLRFIKGVEALSGFPMP